MQIHPANWASLLSGPHVTQFRYIINGIEYGGNNIQSVPTIEKPMMLEPVIGRCCTSTLSLVLRKKGSENIPKAAPVSVDCRLVSDDGTVITDWVAQGRFWITKRSGYGSLISFTCRDAMLFAGQTYADKTAFTEWPVSMSDVFNEIVTLMGVQVDSRTQINTGAAYMIDYPNDDVLMSEILGMIAAAHGGNFIITEQGKLRLVPFPVTADPAFSLYQAYHDFTPYSTGESVISRVTLLDNAGNEFTSGDDTGVELAGLCAIATQGLVNGLTGNAYTFQNGTVQFPSGTLQRGTGTITDSALTLDTTAGTIKTVIDGLRGRRFIPYQISGAYFDPCMELGDTFSAVYRGETLNLIANTITVNCTSGYACQIENGVMQDDEEEIPYLTPQELREKRSVQTNQTYHGNRINRQEGFVSEYTVNGETVARLIANSNLFTMQRKNNSSWVNALYFDPVNRKYVFNGDVEISGGNSVSIQTGGTFTVTGGNFSIDGEGNVTMTGEINAASGTIGGWIIGENALYSDGNTPQQEGEQSDEDPSVNHVHLSSDPDSDFAIWSGAYVAGAAPFRVKRDGTVYVTKLIALEPGSTTPTERIVNLRSTGWKLDYNSIKTYTVDDPTKPPAEQYCTSILLTNGDVINFKRAADSYNEGWDAAAALTVPPERGTSTSFVFKAPLNHEPTPGTTVREQVEFNFTLTKGTPSASGGYAAANMGGYVVAQIPLNDWYEKGWDDAAALTVPPSQGTGTSFVFKAPLNHEPTPGTTVREQVEFNFTLTKGTPSSSGGYAAVGYGGRTVAQISLSNWYEKGWDDAAALTVPPSQGTGTSFVFKAPVNHESTPGITVREQVDFTFTLSKGTPSASGGFAAVGYGGRTVAHISLDDWYSAGETAGQNAVTINKGSWNSGVIQFTKSVGTASTKTVQLTAASASWSGNTASVQIWDGTGADAQHGSNTGYTVTVDASARYTAGQNAGQNAVVINKGSWNSGVIQFTKSVGTASTKTVQLTAASASWSSNTASVQIWDGTGADVQHGSFTGYTVTVDASSRYSAGETAGQNAVVINKGSWNSGVIQFTKSVGTASTKTVQLTAASASWSGNTASVQIWDGTGADAQHGSFTGYTVTVDASARYTAGQNAVIPVQAASWVDGVMVVSTNAPIPQSTNVSLPTFTTSGGTTFNAEHKTTVYFSTASVSGYLKSVEVDASGVYADGYADGAEAGGSQGYTEGYTDGQDSVAINKGSWSSGIISFTKSAGSASTKTVQLTAASASWSGNTASVQIWDGTAADAQHGSNTGYTVTVDASARYSAGETAGQNAVIINKGSWSSGVIQFTKSVGSASTKTVQLTAASATWSGNTASVQIWDGTGADAQHGSNTGYTVTVDASARYSAGETAGQNAVAINKGSWSSGVIQFTKSVGTASTKTVQLTAASASWNDNTASVQIWDGTGADAQHGSNTGYTVTVDATARYNAGYTAGQQSISQRTATKTTITWRAGTSVVYNDNKWSRAADAVVYFSDGNSQSNVDVYGGIDVGSILSAASIGSPSCSSGVCTFPLNAAAQQVKTAAFTLSKDVSWNGKTATISIGEKSNGVMVNTWYSDTITAPDQTVYYWEDGTKHTFPSEGKRLTQGHDIMVGTNENNRHWVMCPSGGGHSIDIPSTQIYTTSSTPSNATKLNVLRNRFIQAQEDSDFVVFRVDCGTAQKWYYMEP